LKRVSAITGGAGGIGRATAIELGKQGLVVIGDLLQENIDYTDKILTSLNIEHYNMVMDVRDRKSCDEFAAFAAQQGPISNFINIAGVGPNTTYTGAELSTSRETYHTNCVGALNTVEAFFPYMGEGSVMIQTASQASYHVHMDDHAWKVYMSCYEDGFLDRLCTLTEMYDEYDGNGQAYCFSKRFVLEHCKASAWRFAAKGARIVTVSPGMHWTCHVWDLDEDTRDGNLGITPLQRFGRTSDLGCVFTFLCGDAARYITGADILVDGGGMTTFGKWRIK
jgi:NAD(P)-dependent dehydrogenase (short-subunit alcohol dehydrogenase family)